MEAAGQFCQDNDVSFTSVPPVGGVLVVSDAAIALAGSAGANVVASLAKTGTIVGNLNLAVTPADGLLDTDGAPLLDTDGVPLLDTE